MLILDTIWKETLWSFSKYEMNVGEYNKLDLVNDNTKKKTVFFCTMIFEMQEKGHNVLLQPMRNLDVGH